jgi:hypothetical protein
MPNEERMTLNERRKYLRLIKKRYLKASKFERGRRSLRLRRAPRVALAQTAAIRGRNRTRMSEQPITAMPCYSSRREPNPPSRAFWYARLAMTVS